MFSNIKKCSRISFINWLEYIFGPVIISEKYNLAVRKRLFHKGYQLMIVSNYYDIVYVKNAVYTHLMYADTYCQLEKYLWHEYQIEINNKTKLSKNDK